MRRFTLNHDAVVNLLGPRPGEERIFNLKRHMIGVPVHWILLGSRYCTLDSYDHESGIVDSVGAWSCTTLVIAGYRVDLGEIYTLHLVE